MGDVNVGTAVYRIAVDKSGAVTGIQQLGGEMTKAGKAAESAFGAKTTGLLGNVERAAGGLVGRYNDLANKGGAVGAVMQFGFLWEEIPLQ